MDHHRFIARTDKKSLFNQIKFLVTCGQESYQKDLDTRRNRLKELLEADDKVYENEFIGKIKSRVDESIRQRQESLLAMKQERTKEMEKIVAAKKLHQQMTNCTEIREELRRKDNRETQLCLLEQMDDKLKAVAREQKDEAFWLNVQQRVTDDIDLKQEQENMAKRNLQAYQCKILGDQLEEHHRKQKMDLEHANKERIALSQTLKANLREERKQAYAAKLAKSHDVKENVNKICGQKKILEQEAEKFEESFHEECMRQMKMEIADELKRNVGLKEAVLDYLTYIRKFNCFLDEENTKRDEAFDQLGKRFFCMKNHPKKVTAQKKRQEAESSHKVLLEQICEKQGRRAELEAFERENKIVENPFARLEVRDKIKERENIRKGLDMQLEEIARLKAEEQIRFSQELCRAEEDKAYCEQLLKRHKADGCDFLPPHPNWKLLACYNETCK